MIIAKNFIMFGMNKKVMEMHNTGITDKIYICIFNKLFIYSKVKY